MKKILIADDEQDLLGFMTDVLSSEGYAVTVAPDGLEALERIKAEPFDLLILDLYMPGMDGASLAYELKMRALSSTTPVIFMSASVNKETREKIRTTLQNTKFLSKPVDIDELLAAVRSSLGG